jgi:hypothetical protein
VRALPLAAALPGVCPCTAAPEWSGHGLSLPDVHGAGVRHHQEGQDVLSVH